MNVYEIQNSYFTVCFYTMVEYYNGFEESLKTLVKFHKRHISLDLVTQKLDLEMKQKKSASKNVELFCFCQQPENEDMIGCDNPSCKYKWFHFTCLKIKRAPKGSWYCRFCKELMKKDKQIKYIRCAKSIQSLRVSQSDVLVDYDQS